MLIQTRSSSDGLAALSMRYHSEVPGPGWLQRLNLTGNASEYQISSVEPGAAGPRASNTGTRLNASHARLPTASSMCNLKPTCHIARRSNDSLAPEIIRSRYQYGGEIGPPQIERKSSPHLRQEQQRGRLWKLGEVALPNGTPGAPELQYIRS